MRRSLSFLVSSGADVDTLLARASERKIDVDKSPSLGRLGSTAVVRIHGDVSKFWGEAPPGSHDAYVNEQQLVDALTQGLNVEQDHSRTITEEAG